ncbi:MAG: periplasmic heavy metal sensor [Acidobacteriota bacterium]|nr:periplasmic heavy metal sensor [Acidobacteriota bacterium]MDQ5871150.1 periplasmic heavy metal sensor [Acidobacteriota bacterium]
MKRIAAALLFAALVLPASAVASPELPDGKWWKRPRVAAAIDLTPEQTRDIEGIFSKSRPLLIDRKADLEKKQGELEDAIEENADRRQIAVRVEEVEDARAELQKARILMLLDMKQVLRAEQWDRLVRMQQEARRLGMDRRERFGAGQGRRPFGRDRSPNPDRRSSPRP